MTTTQSVTTKIESLRKLMIETARIYGFTSPNTIKISQELDTLLLLMISQKNSKDI